MELWLLLDLMSILLESMSLWENTSLVLIRVYITFFINYFYELKKFIYYFKICVS